MKIQLVFTIALSPSLTYASRLNGDTEIDLFYQAYNCNPLALHRALVQAKGEAEEEEKFNICFKHPLYEIGYHQKIVSSRAIQGKTLFQAVLVGGIEKEIPFQRLMDTYSVIHEFTGRVECEGDFLADRALELPKYGIDVAIDLVERGASPLSYCIPSVLNRAIWMLGEDSTKAEKVERLFNAVLAKPKNVELVKGTRYNPMEHLAAYANYSYSVVPIMKKLIAAGFPVDGTAIQKCISTALSAAHHAKDPQATARTNDAVKRILPITRAFFKALQNPFMPVGDQGRLQSIDKLIANCGHYCSKDATPQEMDVCDSAMQRELQSLLNEARHGKDVVLDPHGRRVTIVYFGVSGKDVVVTGTFDGWTQSIKMTPVEGHPGKYQRAFKLRTDEEYLYEFVVDGKRSTQGANVKDDSNGSKRNFI